MFDAEMFNGYTILAGLVFGTLGWGAIRYGRALERWKPVGIGLALMFYPWFVTNRIWVWVVGAGLLTLLWFHHDE
jgi:hypothetical protein